MDEYEYEDTELDASEDDLYDVNGEDLLDDIGEEIEDNFEEDGLCDKGDEADGILYNRPTEEDGEGQKKVIQGAATNLMRSTIESALNF